jgi:hypothetical protein
MNLPNTSRLQFDEKKHAYKLDGKLLSGVTTIIDGTSSKQNLIGWAANMAVDYIQDSRLWTRGEGDKPYFDCSTSTLERVLQEARTAYAKKRDKAGQKGTDAHALVEEYINECIKEFGGKPHGEEITETVLPFAQWAFTNVDRFIAAEQRLYSEKHGFAGTCDFIAVIDGKLTIGDLKTYPKMWSADAFIQMGAYSLCWKELTGEAPQQSVVVKMCDPNDERLKKFGGNAFSVYPRYALEEDEEMFLTRLKMFRYNENFVSPKD